MADDSLTATLKEHPEEWYFMEDGIKVPVPKIPLLQGDMNFRPPGSVTLWDGRVRHIFVD